MTPPAQAAFTGKASVWWRLSRRASRADFGAVVEFGRMLASVRSSGLRVRICGRPKIRVFSIYLRFDGWLYAVPVRRHFLHLNTRRAFNALELLEDLVSKGRERIGAVGVLQRGRGGEVELEIWSVILKVVVVWDFVGHRSFKQDSCLISPASRHVANCVASAAEHKEGETKRFDKVHAGPVAFKSQIKAT